MTEPNVESVEALLRDELARGDASLSTATSTLRHLLVNDDRAMFSDEVVARVRSMLTDVARQLLLAQAEAAAVVDRAAFMAEREDELAAMLTDESAFLAHVHTTMLEAQLALQLQERCNIDAALSPLLQQLVASKDAILAGSAMAVIAAQARFILHHRRMTFPLTELPGELFHKALLVLRSQAGDSDEAVAAEGTLRSAYDEAHGRLGLLSRLVMRLGKNAPQALEVADAGLGIFITALALASKQERELAAVSFSDRQFVRLALALRAAGLEQTAVERQLLAVHPDIALAEGFEMLSADRASSLLASSARQGF